MVKLLHIFFTGSTQVIRQTLLETNKNLKNFSVILP
jgi:hypothetical protein